MSVRLTTHPRAAVELEEIALAYQKCRPELGQEFYADVRFRLQQAIAAPTRFSPFRRHFRRIKFRRWPYIVVFAHDQHQLGVLGVFHVARDPKWIAQQLRERSQFSP